MLSLSPNFLLCSLGEQSHQGPRLDLWELCLSINEMRFFRHVRHVRHITESDLVYDLPRVSFKHAKNRTRCQFIELSSKGETLNCPKQIWCTDAALVCKPIWQKNATSAGRTYATRLVLVVLCLEERAVSVLQAAHRLKCYKKSYVCTTVHLNPKLVPSWNFKLPPEPLPADWCRFRCTEAHPRGKSSWQENAHARYPDIRQDKNVWLVWFLNDLLYIFDFERLALAWAPHALIVLCFLDVFILIGFPKKDWRNLVGKLWTSWTRILNDWIILFATVVVGFYLQRLLPQNGPAHATAKGRLCFRHHRADPGFISGHSAARRILETCRFKIDHIDHWGDFVWMILEALEEDRKIQSHLLHTDCFYCFGSPRVSTPHVQNCTEVFVQCLDGPMNQHILYWLLASI